jgi:hypothetical protein
VSSLASHLPPSKPAILAQRYLAASTSTGVSVVYGNAGIPWSNRYCYASSTSTSPASDATIGFSTPLPRYSSTTSAITLAKTIGGVTIVCQ